MKKNMCKRKDIRKTWQQMIAAALMCIMLCTGCGEKARATTMKLAQTEGTVNIRDAQKAIEPIKDLKLYSGYHVETEQSSYAWIDLDHVKLAKLDALSEIEVQQDGKALEVHVETGSLFFHVTSPLSEDESMQIRTSTMTVGIRGTCGWVGIQDAEHMSVCILEGLVECQVTAPDSAEDQTVSVSGGQKALISLENGQVKITVEQMKESEIPAFVLTELDEALLDEIRLLLLDEEPPESAEEEELPETETEPSAESEAERDPDETEGEPGTEKPLPPTESSGDDTPPAFTDAQLAELARTLGAPDSDQLQITQSEPYYWDAAGLWLRYVSVTNPETGGFGGADFDCYTLDMARSIYMYTEQ